MANTSSIRGHELDYRFVGYFDLLIEVDDVMKSMLQMKFGIKDLSHCAFCGSKIRHVTILHKLNSGEFFAVSEGCFDISQLWTIYVNPNGFAYPKAHMFWHLGDRQRILSGEVLSWKMMSGSQQQVRKMILWVTVPGYPPGLVMSSIPKKYVPRVGDKVRMMGNFKSPIQFTGVNSSFYDYLGYVSRFEVLP